MLSLNRTVKHVDTSTKNRILYNTYSDFHFASQYLTIVHLPVLSNMNSPKTATLLLAQTNKYFVKPAPKDRFNYFHRQSSNWLQCTLTKMEDSSNAPGTLLGSKLNEAPLSAKRLRGSDSFAN